MLFKEQNIQCWGFVKEMHVPLFTLVVKIGRENICHINFCSDQYFYAYDVSML